VHLVSTLRAAEEVSVIDKMGIQPTFRIFHEDGLPVINVPSTYINQPGQAEASSVTDPVEAGTW